MLFKVDCLKDEKVEIETESQTQNGITKSNNQSIVIPGVDQFQNPCISKAVLLHYYASFVRKYIDTRTSSTPEGLQVYLELRKQYPVFASFYQKEMRVIGDQSLLSEFSMLEQLAKDDDIPLNIENIVMDQVVEEKASLKRKQDDDPEEEPQPKKRLIQIVEETK